MWLLLLLAAVILPIPRSPFGLFPGPRMRISHLVYAGGTFNSMKKTKDPRTKLHCSSNQSGLVRRVAREMDE